MSNKKVLNIDFETFLNIISNYGQTYDVNDHRAVFLHNIKHFVKQFDEVKIIYEKENEEDEE